jgi:phospholipid transport system transporter-binding protein
VTGEADARLEAVTAGRLKLVGELSFRSVPELLDTAPAMIGEVPEITVDLADVQRSDSAGVALLVEWMRAVRRQGRSITYLNIPSQMLAIARVSSLDSVLPLFRE